jgi:hypothetical protein
MLNIVERFREGRARARAEIGEPAQAANSMLGEDKKSFAELSALADQLNARVIELEADRAVFAEVLGLPGVKKHLATRFHPDKPDVNENERQWLTERMQKVNAAYEALEKKGAA